MKQLKIFDLDGTIIDSSHRYRSKGARIDLDFWRENSTPEMINNDTFLPHMAEYNKAIFCKETVAVIATARAMVPGDANFDFIRDKMLNPDYIIHRKGEQDNRKGDILKTSGIMKAIDDIEKFDIVTIFEDNFEQLQKMTQFFEYYVDQVVPVFVQSEQGH